MKLVLAYPVKPLHINQPFGANPAYYARFHDIYGKPEHGHMGIDFQAYHGQPVYAACDGMAFYSVDEHGGDGITIQTAPFDYQGGSARFNIINWHLCSANDPKFKPLTPTDGKLYPVKRGQLIGYADNTGAPFESSGDHLHFGLVPLAGNGNAINAANGFNGCINPVPYFDGSFAADPVGDPTLAQIAQDVDQVSHAIQNNPTPQVQGLAAQALALIQKMVARFFG
jgi:murein DD-endopeptidase MepM/ murein hydrolase activator NlpD